MNFPTLLECIQARQAKYESEASKQAKSTVWNAYDLLVRYTADIKAICEFYSQPLALWMFIPCGEDGMPLKRPVDNSNNHDEWCAYECLRQEYQAAEQRVLFEGWELKGNRSAAMYAVKSGDVSIGFYADGDVIVSDMNTSPNYVVKSVDEFASRVNLTPTQSSINQLNLK